MKMKKPIILMVVAFVTVTTVGLAVSSCWRRALHFRHEFECRVFARGAIGQAKLSYAIWKGLTNGSPITAQALSTYFEGDQLPGCPSGGRLTIGDIGEPVRCSLGAHARLPCNDCHEFNPLDMAHNWWMTISGSSKGAMMNLSGVRILFSDVRWGNGVSASNIGIAGGGTSRFSGQIRTGGHVYESNGTYSNGIATIDFAGHLFHITDNGKTIVFGQKTFGVGADRPTILVNRENDAKLVIAWHDLESLPSHRG